MSAAVRNRDHKPRELRRRSLLPIRMRTAAGWSDGCVLNLSSRGLLIHAGRPFVQDGTIEIFHQDHVIVAKVVWRDGAKAGLQAEDRVPIEQILSSAESPGLRWIAAGYEGAERRRPAHSYEDSRQQSRMVEFASLIIVALVAAVTAYTLVSETLARPFATVGSALPG